MSLSGDLGHFFSSHFGHEGDVAQTLLRDISGYVQLAVPLVKQIEDDVKAGPGTPDTLRNFILKYAPDVARADAFLQTALGLPRGVMLRDAAKFALSFLVTPDTADWVLNTAVELAHGIQMQATPSAKQLRPNIPPIVEPAKIAPAPETDKVKGPAQKDVDAAKAARGPAPTSNKDVVDPGKQTPAAKGQSPPSKTSAKK